MPRASVPRTRRWGLPRGARRLAGLAALLASAAQAQSFDAVRLFAAPPGASGGTAGLAVLVGPRYSGSDEHRVLVVPALDYQWANGWFAGFTNGVGVNLGRSPALQFGPRVTVDLGRSESRSPALRGMGDVDPALQLGGFLNWSPMRAVTVSSSLRWGSGRDRDGLLLDLGVSHGHSLAPRWRLGTSFGLTLANAAHQRSFYGVDAAQSLRSGYALTTPGGGLRDLRAGVSLTHFFGPRTTLTTAVSLTALQGDARRSPLVREDTTASAVVALGWGF